MVLSGGPAVGDLDLGLRGLSTPARRVATVPALERAVSGQGRVVALVPLDALIEALPTTQPNTVFLRASPEAQRDLEATAARDRSQLGGLVTGVTTVTGFAADVADRALPSLVAATFLVGVLLAGVLVLPRRPAPAGGDPARALPAGDPAAHDGPAARPRAPPRLGRGAAAARRRGGRRAASSACVVPNALAPALDLAPFTGAVTRLPDPAAPAHGLLVGLVALAIGSLALLTDAASARRGSLADHLRRGDTA